MPPSGEGGGKTAGFDGGRDDETVYEDILDNSNNHYCLQFELFFGIEIYNHNVEKETSPELKNVFGWMILCEGIVALVAVALSGLGVIRNPTWIRTNEFEILLVSLSLIVMSLVLLIRK